ncbi:MAG: sigma-70 family RNA polymerase sigma factor [Planctomycetes bacterium]|nr:sigma-70 family RNA polymerase sigma factor [Planctomycetota bacterium]
MTDATSHTTTTTATDVFEILVREHADMLTAYLHSLVSEHNAVDDLFQETMLVAWRRLGDFDRSRPFGPWLRGIAAKVAMQHYRQSAPARAGQVLDPAMLDALNDQHDRLGARTSESFRARLDQLLDCLQRLPERMRETIELVYARGLLVRQVSESVQASEEAVKKRLQRGRTLLAECLHGHFDGRPGGGASSP